MIFLQIIVFLMVFAWRGRFLFGQHLGNVKKHPGWLEYTNRDKHGTIEGRQVGVTRKDGIAFIIRPERWYHRYFKRVGLATEIAVPDAAFDKKYYVTTDYPHHLEQLLATEALMTALNALAAKGVTEIHATASKVWCDVMGKDMRLPVDKLEDYYNLLNQVSGLTEPTGRGPVSYRVRRLTWWALLFVAVHMAVLICAGIEIPVLLDSKVDIVDDNWLLLYGALVALGVVGLWSWLMAIVFGRTSWIGWVMADFWIWGVAGVLLSSGMWVREWNVKAPQAAEVERRQVVQWKTCTLRCYKRCGSKCSKKETHIFEGEMACKPQVRAQVRDAFMAKSEICANRATYDYEVSAVSWHRKRNEVYRTEVDAAVFDNVHVGGTIGIPVHEGAMGLEWVNRTEVRP